MSRHLTVITILLVLTATVAGGVGFSLGLRERPGKPDDAARVAMQC